VWRGLVLSSLRTANRSCPA